MQYQILSILEPARAEQLRRGLANHPFVDGKATATGGARAVKENRQAERSGESLVEFDRLVTTALVANATFQAFAFPRRLRPPIYSRYEPGMSYGGHVDSAIFNDAGQLLRADLAVTLFLSPPDSYDGGELMIALPYGEEAIKLEAGEAVVYSADSVHRVAPVTRGARLAAVTWVQSAVRDARMRGILFDLGQALHQVEAGADPSLLLAKSYHNLVRITAEF